MLWGTSRPKRTLYGGALVSRTRLWDALTGFKVLFRWILAIRECHILRIRKETASTHTETF